MKKLLGIVVLGLLWCNVGFAEILKFECKQPKNKNLVYINYEIDFDNNTARSEWNFKGKVETDTYTIKSMDNEKVYLQSHKWPEQNWYFYYATNQKGEDVNGEWTSNHNCNYDRSLVKSSINKSEKVEVASMIDKAKDTCKSLGFKEGTEKFADCSLKLYSQSLELAAEQNQTVVMQPQSSGSNKMTIYDPVRDSRALMKQGQRMLSGACTLGIDC